MKDEQQFNNLMNRLSGQAEQERADEQRALMRRNRFRVIRQVALLLLMAALAVGTYHYRDEIQRATADLTAPRPATTTAAANPRAKVSDLSRQVDKHNKLVDDAMK